MFSWISFLLLVLLSFFSFSTCHENDQQRRFLTENSQVLDKIIAKHYERYLSSLPAQKRSKISQASLEETNKRFSYDCVHDNIASQLKSTLSKATNLKPDESLQKIEERSVEKRAFQTIKFETNFVLGNDQYACSRAGERVTISTCSPPCTYICQQDDVQTQDLIDLIQNFVSDAVLEFFTEALEVDHTSPTRLDQRVYNEFGGLCFLPGLNIPQSYVTSGIPNDADYLVFFTARPCDDENTVAYAAACNFDWDQTDSDRYFGRPKAGVVNFCPRHFVQFEQSSYSLFEFAGAVKVGVHEFTHALGFSSLFYPSYLNSRTDNYYRYPTVNQCERGETPSGQSFARDIIKLRTPRIVEIARDHFDCDSLDGIELEDIGGAGTAGSHWEKRVVGDEYMAGFINPSMPVSYLTLSLFEDMGWYRTNFQAAEYWGWGKDLGCPFVAQRCSATTWNSDGYWCESSSVAGCTGDRKAYGGCNLQRMSNVPRAYQHFRDRELIGDIITDGCPYIDASIYCQDDTATATEPAETFGADSRCWPYTPDSSSSVSYSCWNFSCNAGELRLHIGGSTFNCPDNGGDIDVNTLGVSTVNCPPASLFCRTPSEPAGTLTLTDSDDSTPCSASHVILSLFSVVITFVLLL